MRPSFATALLAAVLALAPAVSAQSPASMPLTSTVGTPIAYRIGLPAGWKTFEQEDGMLMVGTERLMIMVGAMDMMEGQENPLPVSEAEARRIMTSMIMGSDSLMFGILNEAAHGQKDAEFRDAVREIRTLGGQRSAFMKGRVIGEETGWVELNVTVKDGILYLLAFGADDRQFAAHEPLFARIRDSFVLAPAPR
jgi:hypothetical protein